MRVTDRPIPPFVLHHDPYLDAKTVRPVIAVQGRRTVAEWDDTPTEVWDDPLLEWDMDLVPGFVDATCDFQGAETTAGPSDDHGQYPAAHAAVQFNNPGGKWASYNADGTPANYGPGYELIVLAYNNTSAEYSWVFRGTITSWDDLGPSVQVEAFDEFANLAQPIGTYTPGVAGQTPADRMAAVLAMAGRSTLPVNLAPGTVTLTAQPSTATPLVELQTVAASDGGILYGDADATVVYAARSWRAGRTDQTVVPVISDNVCTADLVVWDAVLSSNDDNVADTVIVQNLAGLKGQSPTGTIGRFIVTETGLQWTTQTEGDNLAAYLVSNLQGARVQVAEFDVWLDDPHQPAATGVVGWRLFDRIRFLHDYTAAGGPARLDVNMIVQGLNHSILPESWLVSVATTKALSYNLNNVWNPPGDPYWWDLANTVWGY